MCIFQSLEQEKAALDAGAAFAGALDIVKAVIDSPVLACFVS